MGGGRGVCSQALVGLLGPDDPLLLWWWVNWVVGCGALVGGGIRPTSLLVPLEEGLSLHDTQAGPAAGGGRLHV